MTSLDTRKVVLREGLSPDFVALMTPDPTPSAHILRPLEYLTGCGGRGKRRNFLGIIPLYVPEARPGRQGLEIIEGSLENKGGKEGSWKRGQKEMNNKEGKEEPGQGGKRGMNNKEGKQGPWKRGKKRMKTKEGKEESWKRGKAKPEKRTKGWPIKRKRKNPRKRSKKLVQ